MPTGDRQTKSSERCDRHPGNAAVARCERCGRPLCLACATPVRGDAYGAECLAAVLGPDAPLETENDVTGADGVARVLARVAFGLAVLASLLPWSRFGPGSGAFGAWSRSGRWSLVAAIAAIAGLVVTFAQIRPRLRTPAWDVLSAGLGAVVAVASVFAVIFPPAFSRPWLGPWAAVAFGALACGSSVVAGRTAERSVAPSI